jgi:hypothetical protein
MNPRLAHLLIRLYPRSWRERYGAEFEALLEAAPFSLHALGNVAWSALSERVSPTQGWRDQGSRSTQSWCARLPWAIFSLTPLFLLAGAYFVACLVLWCGWRAFLPAADTPFGGRTFGLANLYFQFGRFYYYSAPIVVGWGVELIAVRQRVKAAWPAIGLVLVAWMGAAAHIQASRTLVPRGLGHIRIEFALWPSVQSVPAGLFHALVILSLTILPYLLWQLQKSRPSLS